MATTPNYLKQLHKEIDQTPEEYRGLLLRIVLQSNTQPVDTLWDGMDKQ